MAQQHRPAFERGLALKKMGNRIMETVGGRAIHPVNVKVGGFYRAPSRADVAALAGPLTDTLERGTGHRGMGRRVRLPRRATATTASSRCVTPAATRSSQAGSSRPTAWTPRRPVSPTSSSKSTWPVRPRSTPAWRTGWSTSPAHSPATRSTRRNCPTPPPAPQPTPGSGPRAPNPFQSIIVRAVEIVFACEEALALVERYEPPDPPGAPVPPGGGEGTGATEAPRGLLFHRYHIDPAGLISAARDRAPHVPEPDHDRIRHPPDRRRRHSTSSDDELTWRSEQAVRNHDPCISCATHFLDLTITRR